MAFCSNCGTQIPDGSIFCPGCGSKCVATPQTPSYAEPVLPQDTYVLFPQEPVNAPVQEEAPPAYQPPVYEQPAPPVYQPPVYTPPVYEEPAYQPPAYQPPVATAQPQLSAGTKVKGFLGMGLGIFGLFLSFLSLIIALGSIGASEFGSTAMINSLFGLGSGIAAKILSGKSASEGFSGAPIKLGSIFGLIAIIMGGIAFFFGLIGLTG